jgi:predicted RNase H-like nuclease
MQVVLGIDAAWTLSQPSGIALAIKQGADWRLEALSPSYQAFHALAAGEPWYERRPCGSRPDASELIASSLTLAGWPVDLVAIDMPLAHEPITARRAADNAVSRAYGARKCGTHSPSALRPGLMSDRLKGEFELAGYPLQTTAISPPGLIEVYPHPALVELAKAQERLPYKAFKLRTYWPAADAATRKVCLFQQSERIATLLDGQIKGVRSALPQLPPDARGIEIKAHEDMLDAVVCAWVAICALEGRAKPFGNECSAIWIPGSSCSD